MTAGRLRRGVAEALAKVSDDGAFANEHEDPEMWAANEEDRAYWFRLADAAVLAVHREAQWEPTGARSTSTPDVDS